MQENPFQVRFLGLQEEVRYRITSNQGPLVENADPRTQGLNFFHVMAGVKDRQSLAIEAANFFEDVIARLRIDPHGGFIQERTRRGPCTRAAARFKRRFFMPPEKVPAPVFLGTIEKADRPEDLVDFAASAPVRADHKVVQRKPQVFAGGQFAVKGQILGRHAQQVLSIPGASGLAQEQDAAAIRFEQPGD